MLWEAEIGATCGLKLEVSRRLRLHEILRVRVSIAYNRKKSGVSVTLGPNLEPGVRLKRSQR